MGQTDDVAHLQVDVALNLEALTVEGMGTCVRVEASGEHAPEFTRLLRDAWSRCWVPESCIGPAPVQVSLTPEQTTEHVAPEALVVTEESLPALLEVTTRNITAALISQQAGKLLLFHAGAVCNPKNGRSVAYVAPSRTGKTTLTLKLGKRLGYLTDETVAVDEQMRILTYPKPLSVRSDTGDPRREISPDELGLVPAHPAPYLHRLVILERDESMEGPPQVEELSFFDAVAQLAPQMSSLSALPQALHRLRVMHDTLGPAILLRYRESESIVGLIETLLDVPLVVRRASYSDCINADDGSGEALILLTDQVVRVGKLGVAILDECADPIDLVALAERMESQFGSPGDGIGVRLHTRGAVDALLSQGVLEQVVPSG